MKRLRNERTWGARAALAAAGIALALVTLEGALRLSARLYAAWRLGAPGGGSGETRILCLGDSFTFGLGAPRGKSYPEQLQKLLDRRGGGYRVINGGVPGSNSSDVLEAVRRRLPEDRPAVVLVLTGWNDANLRGSNYWRVAGSGVLPLRRRLALASEDSWGRLRLVRLYRLAASRLHASHKRPAAPWERYEALPEAEIRAAAAALRGSLKAQPSAPEALGLGILCQRLKRYPEALSAFRDAARLDPNDAEARYRLARMLQLYRDAPGAERELREALRLDPRHQAAAELLGVFAGRPEGDPAAWRDPLIEYNLRAILREGEAAGARVLLQTYPNPNPDVAERLARVRPRLEACCGAVWADHRARFAALPRIEDYLSGDEPELLVSHPNAEGYRLLAETVLAKLRETGTVR